MSGLALVLFLITHLAGNLTLFAGVPAFDAYADAIVSNPLLPIAEIGLFSIFVVHVGLALALSRANRSARDQAYKTVKPRGKSTLASRSMLITGAFVGAFVVFHVLHYRVGHAFDDAGSRNPGFPFCLPRMAPLYT